MSNMAIISAAGWKAAGYKDGLVGCPECFLPLDDDGSTSLSRMATFLADNGYEVHIALGTRGYPYRKYVRWKSTSTPPVFPGDFPWGSSPWTQERYDYASRFGNVIEVPDPGGWTTSFDTFCVAMDEIGNDWEHLLLARGDMVIPKECLEIILDTEPPFVFSFTAWHSYFLLDHDGAEFLRAYMEPFRRFATEKSWKNDKNMAPDHWGTAALEKVGFGVYGRDDLPPHKWTDVDTSATYRMARTLEGGDALGTRRI